MRVVGIRPVSIVSCLVSSCGLLEYPYGEFDEQEDDGCPHAVMVTPVTMLVRMSLNRFGLWFISVLFDGVFAWVFVSLVLSFDAADESLGCAVGSVAG